VSVLRKDDAEAIELAIEEGRSAKPVSLGSPIPQKAEGSECADEVAMSALLASTTSVPGLRWEGAVPWQKWTQFYNKVVSRFSNKGLKLRVVVEVAPHAGVSEQDVHETRTALRELGLVENVAIVERTDGSK
jgi:hypothetical protein